MDNKTRLITKVTVISFLSIICLLIAYYYTQNYLNSNRKYQNDSIFNDTINAQLEQNQKEPNHTDILKKVEDLKNNPEVQVHPTMELDYLTEQFEKEIVIEADRQIDLAEAKIRWQQWKDSGQPALTDSKIAGKEPDYFKSLNTIKLAEECFSDHYFASRMGIYNDPVYAFENMKFFHNGFTELCSREDMWEGILHAYDYLLPKIDPNNTRKEIISTSSTFVCLCRLYVVPAFQKQVKEHEAEKVFLAANLRVLKQYQWYLENYDTNKYRTPGFFGEPCSIAQVALMLTKEVSPQRYAQIAPDIKKIRWPQEQKAEDLKSFIDLIVGQLDGIVAD